MSATQVSLLGTLKSDGTLELSEKLDLPPGPVRVTIEVLSEPATSPGGWFEYLQRARAELEASGATFRNQEEIDADLNAMRDEWNRPLAE